jgi:dynein light intermediate chain 1
MIEVPIPSLSLTCMYTGDVSSGKSTLVDRLCQIAKSHPIGGKFPLSGCSLEYRFIDVQDEDTDDFLDRMGVWILDGVVWHSQLLPFVLKTDTLRHTMVMIVADLSQPWNVMESLERWAEVVQKHINSLKVDPQDLKEMEENMVKQFQSYSDPEEPTISTSSEEEGVVLPLGDTTLTHNLGLPIIVVCCKSDGIVELEKAHAYRDEHLDFIQQAIRKFCLNHGAALFYASTKEDKNTALLHKYLLHRAYGLPFKEAACVVDKDSIFIPSGWDTEKKISILYDHMKDIKPGDPYQSVIIPPKTTSADSEAGPTMAEDDQVYLLTQQAHMVRSPKTGGASSSAAAPAKHPSTTPSRPSAAATAAKPEAAEGKQSGETVLANFFNSLLSKKQVGGAKPGGRTAAAAELDKLQSRR